jgi:hypothetical protein
MYTRIHMYRTLNMKCTVLLVFSCGFTKFSLQKHVLLVHLTCKQVYTCTVLYTWNALFCSCFHVFTLSFHCRNMYFWYISLKHKNTPVPIFIHEMHWFASVFMCIHVFSLSLHCRNMYFWYISHKHKNTHVPNFIHEMHWFASVFMCFH